MIAPAFALVSDSVSAFWVIGSCLAQIRVPLRPAPSRK
jgi:hypothetical protein